MPAGVPVVVFNALPWPRTEPVHVTAALTPTQARRIVVLDAAGRAVPLQQGARHTDVLAREQIDATDLGRRLWWLSHEIELAWGVRFADFTTTGDRLIIHAAEAALAADDLIPRIAGRLAGRRSPVHVQVQRLRVELVLLAAEVPALGYKVFVLTAGPGDTLGRSPESRRPTAAGSCGAAAGLPPPVRFRGATMDNGIIAVRLLPNGAVSVRDRAGTTILGNLLEDSGDAGDEYDYSPVDDTPILSRRLRGRVEALAAGPVESRLRVRLRWPLPAALRPNRRNRERRRIDCAVEVQVALRAGSAHVEISTTVDNRARDHRLRVLVPTEIRANHTASDVEFGAIERPLRRSEGSGWAQPPQPTAPHRSWVDIADGTRGVAVITPGMHEHEILQGRDGLTLAVTLLRAVGWLSRDDLRTRPGHTGPGYETPEAQCPGVHRYRYALLPHRGGWQAADLARQALLLRVPLRAVPATRHLGPLPPGHSFLRIVSALYGPDGEGGCGSGCTALGRRRVRPSSPPRCRSAAHKR